MVKVDWRRKTLRSLSSDGRTMVLSGSSLRRGQGQGGPPGVRDHPPRRRYVVLRRGGGHGAKTAQKA